MKPTEETVSLSDEFRKECESTYFKLYYIFDVLNQFCLQKKLDRVPLLLNLDRQEKRKLASANLIKTPQQQKPFCFIEINLIPCAALSSGCFLGVMLHEMNHIRDFQRTGKAEHDRYFYDRLLRVGYDDKQMTFQKNSLFAKAVSHIFQQRLRLRDGLNLLCTYPGTKPGWNEIEFYQAYLNRVFQSKQRHYASLRQENAS